MWETITEPLLVSYAMLVRPNKADEALIIIKTDKQLSVVANLVAHFFMT